MARAAARVGDPRVDCALHLIAIETQRLDELYALLEQANRYGTLVEWLYQRVPHEPNRAVVVASYRRMGAISPGCSTTKSPPRAPGQTARGLRRRRGAQLHPGLGAASRRHGAAQRLPPTSGGARTRSAREARPYSTSTAICCARVWTARRSGRGLRRDRGLDPDFEPALDELIEPSARPATSAHWSGFELLERERDSDRRAELARQLRSCTLGRFKTPIARWPRYGRGQRLHRSIPNRTIASSRCWRGRSQGRTRRGVRRDRQAR